jgi:hypothetical protein
VILLLVTGAALGGVPVSTCPASTIEHNGKFYIAYTSSDQKQEPLKAQNKCANGNGMLAMPKTDDEILFLKGKLNFQTVYCTLSTAK